MSPRNSTALVVRPRTLPATFVRLKDQIPSLIRTMGRPAETAWHDFFDGRLANEHTRLAYNRALRQFLAWVQKQGKSLLQVTAGDVGQYFQRHPGSLPTQKQHLAALRRFFNLLVERHVMILNPAAYAQTERYSVVEGKTPEITRGQIRQLLKSLDLSHVVGLRDRAILLVLLYTTVRAGAVARLRRRDYYKTGRQWVLHFREKGGKSREIPVRHDLEEILDAYVDAAKLWEAWPKTPLFQSTYGRERRLTGRVMRTQDVCRMIRRRMAEAELPENLTAHSFRVAAITDLIKQGVPIEDVQYLAGHSDARTTRLYDRSSRRVTRNIVERISL